MVRNMFCRDCRSVESGAAKKRLSYTRSQTKDTRSSAIRILFLLPWALSSACAVHPYVSQPRLRPIAAAAAATAAAVARLPRPKSLLAPPSKARKPATQTILLRPTSQGPSAILLMTSCVMHVLLRNVGDACFPLVLRGSTCFVPSYRLLRDGDEKGGGGCWMIQHNFRNLSTLNSH